MRYARRLTMDEGNKRLDASTRRACIDPDALSEIERLLTNSDSGPHGSSPDLKAECSLRLPLTSIQMLAI